MAFYSFGGVNDQCGVVSWAVQETGMLPLLSCNSGKTAWLKHKQKGSSVSGGEEEDLVMPKLQVIENHTRAQMALISVYGTPLLEERQ